MRVFRKVSIVSRNFLDWFAVFDSTLLWRSQLSDLGVQVTSHKIWNRDHFVSCVYIENIVWWLNYFKANWSHFITNLIALHKQMALSRFENWARTHLLTVQKKHKIAFKWFIRVWFKTTTYYYRTEACCMLFKLLIERWTYTTHYAYFIVLFNCYQKICIRHCFFSSVSLDSLNKCMQTLICLVCMHF